MELPRIYSPAARLIGLELVEVKPLSPPLSGSWPFGHITYEWDDTPWRLEQRKLKIAKLHENIQKNKKI